MGDHPKGERQAQLESSMVFVPCNVIKSNQTKLRVRPGAVCSVGWEPNPAHTPVLERLEDSYNRCGWKVADEN